MWIFAQKNIQNACVGCLYIGLKGQGPHIEKLSRGPATEYNRKISQGISSIISWTVDTPSVTQFWVFQNSATKGVSERFCDDPLVKQLNK